MKSLEQLVNVEKGRLLHELFPAEVPALLRYVKETCTFTYTNKDIIQAHWTNGLLTCNFWFTLSENVIRIIDKYDSKLVKSSRLFADQLFDGYTAIFTIDCIVKYAKKENENKRFLNAVEMLFT